jgi:DNA modification methylase
MQKKDVGHTQEGKQEANKFFGEHIFDYLKTVRLIKRLLQTSIKNNDDVVLDFFTGSDTMT